MTVPPAPEGPQLRTPRLLLRRFVDADRAPFAALNADPRVMEHMPGLLDAAASDALVERIDRHWDEHGFGLWAVEVPGAASFVGFTGLSVPSFEPPFAAGDQRPVVEVGWRLAAAAWGHGYATEAARAAVADGFERLGLTEIVSFTVPANARSRAVMARLGMTYDPVDDFGHPGLPEEHPLRPHVMYRLRR